MRLISKIIVLSICCSVISCSQSVDNNSEEKEATTTEETPTISPTQQPQQTGLSGKLSALNESAKESPSLLRRMRMLPDQSIDKTTAQGAVDRSKSNDSPLSVLILESEKLDGNGGSAYQTSSGLSVQVRHASGALEKGSFVVDGTGDDLVERWLMDLDPSSEQLLEVIYQWK